MSMYFIQSGIYHFRYADLSSKNQFEHGSNTHQGWHQQMRQKHCKQGVPLFLLTAIKKHNAPEHVQQYDHQRHESWKTGNHYCPVTGQQTPKPTEHLVLGQRSWGTPHYWEGSTLSDRSGTLTHICSNSNSDSNIPEPGGQLWSSFSSRTWTCETKSQLGAGFQGVSLRNAIKLLWYLISFSPNYPSALTAKLPPSPNTTPHSTCDLSSPTRDQTSTPPTPHWKLEVLTNGLPGRSLRNCSPLKEVSSI